MKKSRVTILVVGALVAGLTIGGMSIASAANRTSQVKAASYSAANMMGTTSPVATLSNLTGLSVQEIQALRAQGKSLSAIASDNGIDPVAVVDQTVAARQTYLVTLVASGKITAAEEQTALDKIRVAVQAMMEATPSTSTRPSPTTPSVPATGTFRNGYWCPTYRSGNSAPAAVSPRTGSGTAGHGYCDNYAAQTSGANRNATRSQDRGSSYSGGSWSGSRGNGSCGW